MQFMKNANIKRAANNAIIDAHKTAIKDLSPRRHEYSDVVLIDWFMQAHKQCLAGDLSYVEGKKVNDAVLSLLTELTVAFVIRKLKYDPPQSVKEYKIIDDEISKNMHLFIDFKKYLK